MVERLCDNRVAREPGKITYTQMLNSRGGIECDFTVTRLADERFSIVTGTAFGNHDREWIRRHLGRGGELDGDGSVQVHDVTSQWACFGVWGPKARDVLQPLTPQDLGNEAFPYMSVREITVGNVPVRALRVTYVGELGWELYCPTEYGLGLWRALWEAGEPHGMVAARLPRDRLDAAREGLSGLGGRHHPRRDPLRGRPRLRGQARQGGRLHRPRGARRGEGAGARQAPGHDPARGPALGRARQRAGPNRGRDLRAGHHRRLRLYGRALDRLRLRAAGSGRAGQRGRDRDLRQLDRRRDRRGAPVRPGGERIRA